jgi:hypothetical protein
MTVNKKTDQTDGFAVTVCHVKMSNNGSVFFSKFEEGWKNTVVAYFEKLGSFMVFRAKKKDFSILIGI